MLLSCEVNGSVIYQATRTIWPAGFDFALLRHIQAAVSFFFILPNWTTRTDFLRVITVYKTEGKIQEPTGLDVALHPLQQNSFSPCQIIEISL